MECMEKKVLFVIKRLAGDGAERALSNIMVNMPNDWEIDLMVNNKNDIGFPYKGRVISLNIPEKSGFVSIVYQIYAVVKRAFCLKKQKKENHYMACVSFLDSANISNVLSGNRYCKTIVSIRLNMTSKKSGILYRVSAMPLMKLVYSHADKIVAVSKEIEKDLKERYGFPDNQITTIVNGYNVSQITKQSKKKPESNKVSLENRKIVITVGRLDSQKGQWHLIRAFRKVVVKEPVAVLLILGKGNSRAYLKQIIENNNLGKNVYLVGYCNNPFYYSANADVFVLPSMYEGFPNALAEAVCCGAPCIATDFHSGAREILSPNMDLMDEGVSDVTEAEYGILTPLCSGTMYKGDEPLEEAEEKLAEAILMLLEDKEKNEYYRNQSRLRSKTLGIDSVVQQWIKVIEE
jgi:glycosyltransferase involved in cell wall biosynthesis